MTQAEEAQRYRALAVKAWQSAARSTDDKIRAAYADVAIQYEELAASAERLASRARGWRVGAA